MFCIKCGQKLLEGSTFCERCGASTAGKKKPESATPAQTKSPLGHSTIDRPRSPIQYEGVCCHVREPLV